MMAETVAKMNMNKLTRHITLRVKFVGVREHKARMKIGTSLIKLGALVIGCGIEIVNDLPQD